MAKMASDFQKPDRLHTLYPEEIEKKMWPLPVSELFFVGRAYPGIRKRDRRGDAGNVFHKKETTI